MPLRDIFRRRLVRVILLTALWAFSLLIRLAPPNIYIQVILVAVGSGIYVPLFYYDLRRPKLEVEQFLHLLAKSIWPGLYTIRANVMAPNLRRNTLAIKYSYNMEGHVDRKLEIPIGSGCAGVAFEDKTPHIVDLTKEPHDKYEIKSGKVWKGMKTIISCPIFHPERPEEVIAILNVDTDLTFSQAGFDKEETFLAINNYCDIIAEVIAG